MASLGRTFTCALQGVVGTPVTVEARVERAHTPYFSIIGLGDSAIKESKERVMSALESSGFTMPNKVLVSLAPAEMKKEGAAFDLPIALSIAVAVGDVPAAVLKSVAVFGELALDGGIRKVRGILPLVIQAKAQGALMIIVPTGNVAEASLVRDMQVVAFEHLGDLMAALRKDALEEYAVSGVGNTLAGGVGQKTFSDVIGQETAKRALEIAATGLHNVLMIGPPGCGKSMMAERFPSLLAPLSESEQLECVTIHSVAGLPVENLLSGQRPNRAPHHLVSEVGLVGGGQVIRPGEISLAHNGILFLDEFPEFRRPALEALRAPLESGKVLVTRAKGNIDFPARFQMLAAMNPCPCGKRGLPDKRGEMPCMCTKTKIAQYLKKLSQPILDRIDLQVELEPVPVATLAAEDSFSELPATEDARRERIMQARERAIHRFGNLNGTLTLQELRKKGNILEETLNLLEQIGSRFHCSARSFTRILRVARTIADLDASDAVASSHLAEAASLRRLDRLKSSVMEA